MSHDLMQKLRLSAEAASARRSIEIPEWGDGTIPFTLHYTPATLADIVTCRQISPDNDIRQNINLVCLKSTDAAGNKLFKMGDAIDLMSMPAPAPAVLMRIASAIDGRLQPEQPAKN